MKLTACGPEVWRFALDLLLMDDLKRELQAAEDEFYRRLLYGYGEQGTVPTGLLMEVFDEKSAERDAQLAYLNEGLGRAKGCSEACYDKPLPRADFEEEREYQAGAAQRRDLYKGPARRRPVGDFRWRN